MSLKDLFNKHGCDKSEKHQYHLFYDKLFAQYSGPIKVLEIGVYKGDSTAAFIEYRPKAKFYGVDTFERITMDDVVKRVNGPVKLAECDSTDPTAVRNAIRELGTSKFDIIIDDGAHHPEANRLTLENFFQYVKPGGTYVVEDVWPLHKMNEQQMQHYWLRKHPDRFNIIKNNMFMNLVDTMKNHRGIEVNEFDNRSRTAEPDSYILSFRKPL